MSAGIGADELMVRIGSDRSDEALAELAGRVAEGGAFARSLPPKG